MTSYVCMNCGYRLETEKPVRNCPYCDRAEMEKERTAEELVNSVEVE